MPFDAERIAARLAAHTPDDPSDLGVTRRAATAAILRFTPDAHVLLITRAERAGDRWSGHVSMPGGMQHAGEELLATARRETHEETAIDLARASLLGRLGATRAIAKGKILPMTITCFVFRLDDEQPIALSDEAVDSFWFPLGRAATGELDDRYEYRLGPIPWTLPCWRWEGRTVWGLTHQMLSRLIEIVR